VRERPHVREARSRLRDVAEPEVVEAGLPVKLGAEPRQRGDRLDLAGEDPLPIHRREEQRLHPEAVAREQQRAPATVVQREREDPPEPLDEPLALLLVQVHEHFRVGGAPEHMAAALQLGA